MDKTRIAPGNEVLCTWPRHRWAAPCPLRNIIHTKRRLIARRSRRGLRVDAYVCEFPDASAVHWQEKFDEQYIVGERLGKGSFGEVFLALDRYTGEEVAVKDMPMTRGKLGPERTLQKITREVVVMNHLGQCPSVVDLLGCFRYGDRYRIVMEFCGGGDLNYHLKSSGPFSELQAVLVAYEILKVICACHDRDIVHGDVKTANFVLKSFRCNPFEHREVSLLRSGWMKAIDFGCSQFVDDFVRIRSRVGTPVFMAPEVFQRNYSFESDLWSLGILVYQLVAGRFPFWHMEDSASVSTVHDVMAMVNAKNPDFSYGPWPCFSSEGLDFLHRLLDKNYQTRMTAAEAFNHPWIRKHIHHDSHGDVVVNNIVPAGNALVETVTTEPVVPVRFVC